jgi:hypothetical protein
VANGGARWQAHPVRSAPFLLSLAMLVAAPVVSFDASAFVSPGYRVRSRAHAWILGRWRIVGARMGADVQPIDGEDVLEIGPSTIAHRVGSAPEGETAGETATYRVVGQDDSGLELAAEIGGDEMRIDVLVESSEAITLYFMRTPEAPEVTIRLERTR